MKKCNLLIELIFSSMLVAGCKLPINTSSTSTNSNSKLNSTTNFENSSINNDSQNSSSNIENNEDNNFYSEKLINVYLIGGQSNAVGYGKDNDNSLVSADSRYVNGFDNVLYYGAQERYGNATDDNFQPVKFGLGVDSISCGAEVGIASAIADENEMNAIIKCAWGATYLYPDTKDSVSHFQGTWTPPSFIEKHNIDTNEHQFIGGMYQWWEETVIKGLDLLMLQGYTPVIKGMWWMQGEAEMWSPELSSTYNELLRTLISDVRKSLSNITGYDCSETPFVFGLPTYNKSYPYVPPYENAVRNALRDVANDKTVINASYIDCLGLGQQDEWHFKANDQKYLGEKFIEQLDALNEGNNSSFDSLVGVNNDIKFSSYDRGFEVSANVTSHNNESGNKYGFLFIPTNSLIKHNITNDYINQLNKYKVTYQKEECSLVFDQYGDYHDIYFKGSIKDINGSDVNTSYTAIAYIESPDGSYLYSSNHIATSLSYLASKELYGSKENLNGLKQIISEGLNGSTLILDVAREINLVNSQNSVPTNMNLKIQPDVPFFVRYTSSNPSIVDVDEYGYLRTYNSGTVNVTIDCGGVSKDVTVIVKNKVIDGVTYDGNISSNEYVSEAITKSNGKTSATIYGMVKNNNIHLALEITHGAWSKESHLWYNNDNIEMYIDNTQYIVKFIDGVPVFPNEIDHAVVNTITSNGKLITTVEMFMEGTKDQYKLKLGMNGTQFSWLGLLWTDTEQKIINSNGLTSLLPANLTIDGTFNESYWTEEVKRNSINTEANGAKINIMGTIIDGGVLLGVTVIHSKAPEVSINGETNYWNYMNIEIHFNGDTSNAFLYTCLDKTNGADFYGKAKTVNNGTYYTTTFEIFIPFASIGVSNDTTSIDFTLSGWFENSWAWLFTNLWAPSHKITKNGIVSI